MSDGNLPLAYAVSRLRHPEHPGMTRREYVAHRRWIRRRMLWLLLAAGGASLLVTTGNVP
jgi:hypothetical protein